MKSEVSVYNILQVGRPFNFSDRSGEDLRRNNFRLFFRGDIPPLTELLYEELYQRATFNKYGLWLNELYDYKIYGEAL